MKTTNAILFSLFHNLRAIPLIVLTVVGLSAPSLRADTVQYSTEVSGNGIRAGWTGSGFGYCANYYTTAAGRIGSLVNSYACSSGASSSTFQIVWAGDGSGSAKPAGGAYAVYNFCQAHETLKGATGLTVNITYTDCGGNAASTTTCGHSGADDTWRRIGDLWLDGAMTAPTIKFTWASGGLSSSARWYSEQFKLIQVAGLYAVHIDSGPSGTTTLCAGGSYGPLAVNAGNTTGPTYQWRKDGSAISGATGSSYTDSSVTTGDAGTYDCVVSGTYGGPVTSSSAVLVVISPPTTASAGADQNVCGSLVATMAGNTPSVGSGSWSKVSGSGTVTFGNASSPTSTATASAYGTYVLRWTISNSPCTASTDDMTVNYYATPTTANAGTDQTQCETSTATLAGNTPTVGTGTWTRTGGSGTITTPSSPTSGVTGLGYGVNTFLWTIHNGTCSDSTDSMTITRYQNPTTANAGTDQTQCETSTATLAGNTPTVGTGTWTRTGGSGTITTPSSPTSGVTGLGYGVNTFLWTIHNGTCSDSTDSMTITRYQNPTTANAGTDQTQCETSTATLAGNTPTVGTGTWTLTGGSGTITTPSSPTSGVTGLGYGVNTFLWTIHNGTCSDSTDSMTITRYAAPSTSAITGANAVCASQTGVAYSVTSTGGSSYGWTVPSGASVASGQGTASITVDFGSSSGDVAVTETNASGCVGTLVSQSVTVNALPSITTDTTNQTACVGAPVTWSVAATGPGLTYQWQRDGTNLVEGVDNFTGTTTATLTNSGVAAEDSLDVAQGYACVITTSSACSVASTLASLTVNALPSTSAITGTDAVNANQAGVAYSVVPTGGSSYGWTVPSEASVASGQGTASITVDFGSSSGDVAVTETNASGCVGTPVSQSVTVNQASPTTTALVRTTGSSSETYGSTLTFTATVSGSGTPGGNVIFKDGSTPLSTNALVSGSAVYTSYTDLKVTGSPHSIAADYQGDDTNGASDSSASPISQTITAKALTVTGLTASAKIYDGTTAEPLGGAAGFPTAEAPGSGSTSDGAPYDVDSVSVGGSASGVFATKDAGTAKPVTTSGVIVTGPDSGNYSVTQQEGLTADITQATLNVSANGTLVYGQDPTNAVYTPVYYPLLDGDTEAVVSGDATFSTDATATSYIGSTYTVTTVDTGTLTADNYSFAAGTNGIMTVTPAPLTVTNAIASDKDYDGTTVAAIDTGAAGLDGLVNGDEASVTLDSSLAAGTFDTRDVGTGKTVTFSGFATLGDLGTNYTVTQPTTTASIYATNLTVTAADNTKTYDGGTTAAATPTITAGSIQTGDTEGAWTETYDTRDAGTGKTLTPAGTMLDGNGGANYNVTFTPVATGEIDPASLTVTAADNTKTYDGGTTATATPTITAGSIQSGDTEGAWTETYDTRNAGTGKTLTPAGVVGDGNGGANYNVTFTPVATGEIDPTSLTVTAAANTKTYDGTTSATATPTITAGSIQSGDTEGVWTETYDTRNAGTGKTLTPAGVVGDGNGGANYNVTFTPVATGEIDPAGLTVTAAANTKTYDGGTSATATPTITAGSIQSGDTEAAWTETYDTKNAGTGKTLTPAGVVGDGNGEANYNVTFTPVATGEIDPASLTVTAAANTKTYDGDTTAAATPTITAGSIQSGDTEAAWTETYDTRNAGTGKTLTPAGVVGDGNGGANYNVTFMPVATGEIDPASLTVTAAANTKSYDGNTTATATPTITAGSIQTGDTGSFTETYDNANAGTGKTLTPAGTVNDGNGGANYNVTLTPADTGVINQATLYVSANGTLVYGQDPATAVYTPVYYTFLNGDTEAVVTGSATFSTDATATSYVGATYTVTTADTTGLSAANYSFAAGTNGIMTVTPAALTVTNVASDKLYDGTTTAPINGGASLDGLVNGDEATVTLDSSGASGTFDTRDVGTGKTVTFSGFATLGDLGTNYTVTQPTGLASIYPTNLTVTAADNTKTYDGGTTAAATPTITAGSIQSGDTEAAWTETYDTRNAGTGKTLTPAGVVGDGNGGANYNVTFTPVATGEIDPASLTVTAAANTKTYDGDTTATATPTITAGSIQSGDTEGAWTETYDTRNAGTGKTLTPAGVVGDGNGGANYNVTFTPVATGEIDPAGLTVTAAANTKTYDGSTSATATPTITAGSIQSGDTEAAWTETYDTKNAGTGKTLTPAGVVGDGNGGANYNVTFTPVATGEIDPAGLTVTAAADTKTYDGTTSATATPTITAGSIQTGDTASFTETYDTRNVGTGKTLTPAGAVIDGNGGANYNVTLTPVATGEISQASLTVTAAANTKTYDGTTSATATPTITAGSIQTGDTAPAWTETYDTRDVGTGKTLTPAGAVDDGNGEANYNVTLTPVTTGEIDPASLTVTAADNTKTYDGTTSATATPTITAGSIQAGDTAPAWTETYDTRNAGTGKTLTPAGVVADGNGGANYNVTLTPVTTGEIDQAGLTVTAATNTKTYDGDTTAAATPTITAGSIQTGDTAPVWTETYDTAAVGTGKTLTPAGVVLDGNAGANYSYTYTAVTTGVINSSVPCGGASSIVSIVDNLDGTFTLTCQGTANAEYYLVGNSDLTAAMNTWTPVLGSTNTAPDPSGQWSSIVSNAAPYYYRVQASDPCP